MNNSAEASIATSVRQTVRDLSVIGIWEERASTIRQHKYTSCFFLGQQIYHVRQAHFL